MENGEMIAKRMETFSPDDHHDPKIDDEKPKENPIRNDPKIRTSLLIREDVLCKNDLERKMKDRTESKRKLVELLTAIEKRLSPSEKTSYTSLCNDFKFRRLAYSKFTTSVLLLIKKYNDLYQGFRQVVFGNIERQEDHEVEESRDDKGDDLSDPKIGTGPKIKIKLGKNRQERESFNVVVDKKNQTDERPLKKPKTLKRYERGSPSYRLIPEEERSPVSSTALNNTYMLRKVFTDGGKELTDIEEELKKYEDQMYEADMVVEALRSAAERAKEVMRGERRLDDLGVKFYRCIEQMYDGRDMFELVRKYRQRALHVILKRLNQKLLEVRVERKSFKPAWKKAIEDAYAKQRASQGHKEK